MHTLFCNSQLQLKEECVQVNFYGRNTIWFNKDRFRRLSNFFEFLWNCEHALG